MKKIRDLPNVGVEYEMDFSTASNDEMRELGQQIHKDIVVLVRNNDMSDQEVVDVCRHFGNLQTPQQYYTHKDHPEILKVTNRRDINGNKAGVFADKELDWHSNGNGRDSQAECCIGLYCVQNGINSITSFANSVQAYDDLPIDVRELVNDIDGLFKFENNTFYDLDEGDGELDTFRQHPSFKDGVVKPIVYRHPWTDDVGLYYVWHFIRKMWRRSGKDFSPAEERDLGDFLQQHVTQEKYVYHHDTWRPGDFIFMDQFNSMHKRNEVEGDRLMYRLCFDYRKVLRPRLR
jgi:alpha-ketoglutarate-dependent taurine dioxygenase